MHLMAKEKRRENWELILENSKFSKHFAKDLKIYSMPGINDCDILIIL